MMLESWRPLKRSRTVKVIAVERKLFTEFSRTEFSLEKNISGMRLKARATGNLSTTNLKLDSQLKQQTEYQKPTTAGGGSDSGDNPDPKPDGGGEAPDPAA
jgi:hypothetical protein